MTDAKAPRWHRLLWLLTAVVVIAAFLPALDIFIAGDDFEWLDASYDIVDDPLSSFRLINHFFRPLVKWTYLVDYLIFRQAGVGYMVTNLLIHLFNAVLLAVLLGRRLRQQAVAIGAAAAFALSPLHSEAVLWAAGRPETVLLGCWLGAILVLDRWRARPTSGLVVAFTGVAVLGAGAKESWIVFPFLASAYLLWVLRVPSRGTVRATAALWIVWIVYVAVFLVRPVFSGGPSPAHYADFQFLPAIFKTGSTILGFCGLGWLPVEGWGAVVLCAFIAAGVLVWLLQARDKLGPWAMFWLGFTLALVAPFSDAVLRHNYLPLAGFWILAASICDGVIAAAIQSDQPKFRKLVFPAAAAVAVIVLVAEAVWLQREIADYRLYGDLHRRLCRSYAEIDPEVPRDRPLVLIDRGAFRGVNYVIAKVQGRPKTFFVRGGALWQLVFMPPLVNFVGQPFDERLEPLAIHQGDPLSGPVTVVLLEDRGFQIRPDLDGAVREAVAATGGLPPGVSLYRFNER